jgi:hypothetical protein
MTPHTYRNDTHDKITSLLDTLFAMSDKSSTDLWARVIGIGGLLVALIGLLISYYTFREQQKLSDWQKSVQQESLTEKLQNNVCLIGRFAKTASFDTVPSHGGIRIEIVNVGQTKTYLKEVELRAGDSPAIAIPMGRKALPLGMEPGMNAYFEIRGWDYAKHPLSWKKDEKDWEAYKILVTTTKRSYELEGHTNQFEIIRTLEWPWSK